MTAQLSLGALSQPHRFWDWSDEIEQKVDDAVNDALAAAGGSQGSEGVEVSGCKVVACFNIIILAGATCSSVGVKLEKIAADLLCLVTVSVVESSHLEN